MVKLYSFDEKIGLRIKLAREQAGMTQEQLAERIDKSLSFISMLEQGRSGAKVNTLKDICLALNTSADFLLLGITPENEDMILAQKLRCLSYADRVALMQIIDSLAEVRSVESDHATSNKSDHLAYIDSYHTQPENQPTGEKKKSPETQENP